MNLSFIHTLDARACAPASIRLRFKDHSEAVQKLANEQAEKTNEWNYYIHLQDVNTQMKMQRDQNAWNREQWLAENEYNKPSEQVKRLREAGLNPALVDSLSPGNSTGAPSASAPSVPSGGQAQQPQIIPPQYRSGMDEILSYLTQAAEIWEKRASIAQMQVATDVAKQKLPYELLNMDANTGLMQQQKTSGATLLPYQIEAQMAESLKNRQQAALTYYQTQSEKMRPQEIAAGIRKTAADERVALANLGRIEKLTGAEFIEICNNAYKAAAEGSFIDFKKKFAREHGFPLENSNFLNRLGMAAIENPEQAKEYVDNLSKSIKNMSKSIRENIVSGGSELIDALESVGVSTSGSSAYGMGQGSLLHKPYSQERLGLFNLFPFLRTSHVNPYGFHP